LKLKEDGMNGSLSLGDLEATIPMTLDAVSKEEVEGSFHNIQEVLTHVEGMSSTPILELISPTSSLNDGNVVGKGGILYACDHLCVSLGVPPIDLSEVVEVF
jgi:hypothetical protein